jgi:glycolate oxidase iron-sulfur subunit
MAPRVDGALRVVDEALLRQCVHCGLCLDACPTYVELGTEMDSPRGRIHLVAALQSGALEIGPEVVRHLDLCLGCRGCETACPSGVRYGRILEEARSFVRVHHRRSIPQRLLHWSILKVFPEPRLLVAALWPIRVLRRLGAWSIVERLVPAARLVPPFEAGAPLPEFSAADDDEKSRVGLLRGCVASVLFAATNAATVRVLNRSGASVSVPGGQGCCGALHLHGGDLEAARGLARRNIDAFGDDLDAIVVNAAGCGSAMREYGELLVDDPRYAERARAFARRVRDVSEAVLALDPQKPPKHSPLRVTYHDACHLAHGQGVRSEPRALLSRVAGFDLVPLAESELCCGSAGSYNLTEPQMAAALGERKVANIEASGAACVAVGNPGCALQIRAALQRRGSNVRVAHPIELLDEAYRGVGSGK